jgi:hypothetical protein
MSGEEMEKAIEFLLNQQAQLTADVGQLSADVGQLERSIKEMGIQAGEDRKFVREIVHEMAKGIAEQAVSAEADRQKFQTAIDRINEQAEEDRRTTREMITLVVEQANTDRQEIRTSIQQVTEQANTDRQEFRAYIQHATEQAEADRAALWAVIGEVHAINERVSRLESQGNRQ